MIVPSMTGKYLRAAGRILDGNMKLSDNKEISGSLIREVIDPEGNPVNINQEQVPQDSVGIIRCVGSMYKYGSWFNWGSDELVAYAREFDSHPNIIGQVWRDDSGGGTISSVGPYLEFLRYKRKPVVSLLDLCGSANYYKNCGTDYMMAENDVSSMFGSIGVMLQILDFTKMLEQMGIEEHVIYADESDYKNKAFKLALEGKYELIKDEFLNPAAVRFQNHVKENRPGLNEGVEGILRGKMFFAEEALEHGLIDSIGSLPEAIDRVKFLAAARSFISV